MGWIPRDMEVKRTPAPATAARRMNSRRSMVTVVYPTDSVVPDLKHRRRRLIGALLLLVSATLAACDGEPAEPESSPSAAPPTTTAGGELEGARCEGGFTRPSPGSDRFERGVALVGRFMRVRGEFEVDEMRYFEGPESPPSGQGYLEVVRRWYVKGRLADRPGFRARWLVEERIFGAGVVAVAPFDTEGFRSPDWVGFQYESTVEREPHPGLPGRYRGAPYDFVTGGDVFKFPGLPLEVAGCLDDT